jgi:hypothetical protein
MKIKIMFFLFLLCSIFFCTAYAHTDRTVTGIVADIDTVGRRLVIRVDNYSGIRSDQLVFQVPKSAVFTRGARKASFLSINISDTVSVTYYSDDFEGLKVRSVANLNMGNQ